MADIVRGAVWGFRFRLAWLPGLLLLLLLLTGKLINVPSKWRQAVQTRTQLKGTTSKGKGSEESKAVGKTLKVDKLQEHKVTQGLCNSLQIVALR